MDPSGVSAAATLTTGALGLTGVLKRNPDAICKLTKTVSKAPTTNLKNSNFHMPAKGAVLLPQMLEKAALMPSDLAEFSLDPDQIMGRFLNRHVVPELRSGEMAEAFCNWLRPPLTKLLDDPEFTDKLAPAIWRTVLENLNHIRKTTDETAKLVEVTAQQLDKLTTLPRDTLELMASRFEITTAHALSDPDLLSVLTKKVEEYRGCRTLIDGLDEWVAAIANLNGAAQDAAERLDFEKVETLLSRVGEVETEIAADTKQARAANALQRGKMRQAYDIPKCRR